VVLGYCLQQYFTQVFTCRGRSFIKPNKRFLDIKVISWQDLLAHVHVVLDKVVVFVSSLPVFLLRHCKVNSSMLYLEFVQRLLFLDPTARDVIRVFINAEVALWQLLSSAASL